MAQPSITSDIVVRRIAAVLCFVAATLAVASVLHLSGDVHGRSAPFDADHAGTAEAIIGIVVVLGAVAMVRNTARARTVGLATTGFAVAGFLLGLSMTARGGDLPDIAYHVTLLPILIGTLVVLMRTGASRAMR